MEACLRRRGELSGNLAEDPEYLSLKSNFVENMRNLQTRDEVMRYRNEENDYFNYLIDVGRVEGWNTLPTYRKSKAAVFEAAKVVINALENTNNLNNL